jgi:hypothetical protein
MTPFPANISDSETLIENCRECFCGPGFSQSAEAITAISGSEKG